MPRLKTIHYLSSSEIISFSNCAFYFYNKYIKTPNTIKNKKEKYVSLIDENHFRTGRYRHKVLELYMSNGKKNNILNIAKDQLPKYNISFDEYTDSKKVFETFIKRPYINYKVLSTEKEYSIILDNGIAVNGTIDLLLEKDKNTIIVTDYKSGAMRLDQNYLEQSIQMRMYALIIKMVFPQYKNIYCQIDALNFDVFEKKADDKWLNDFKEYITSIYQNFVEKKNESDFKPKLCSMCINCEYYKICPLMSKLDTLKINPLEEIKNKDLKLLSEQYVQFFAAEKNISRKKDLIKDIILKSLRDADNNIIDEKWGIIKLSANNRLNIKFN